MDRDDSLLTTGTGLLTTTGPDAADLAPSRVLEEEEYHAMPDRARRYFDALKCAVTNLDKALQAGNRKRPLCAIWSAALKQQFGLDLSAERLRKVYDAWSLIGERALVNKSLCGRKVIQKKHLPAAVVDEFWGIYLSMKDKASAEAAWRTLMERLVTGKRLNGGLTWTALYMKLNPGADVPPHCPWNHHNPPPGWSAATFASTQRPSDLVMALALQGMGAAKAKLAQQAGVRIAWDSLRIGECYMIDDHDVDFRCMVQGQLVRLRLIVLIEVRTRRIMAYVVRPRLKDDDGTERSISRRDVQHLLAGWLSVFGLPRDYPAYLHCENAAAAVTAEFEAMLAAVTKGRLHIDRTALYGGVCQMASFRQSGGTPTGKAPIESKFRLFDITLAHLRGATGRNYIHKPEEHQGRLNAASAMIKRVQALPDIDQSDLAHLTQEGDVKFPFMSLREANEEIFLAIQRMDARTWHAMEGFLQVPEFRTSADSQIFYPLHRDLFDTLSSEAQAIVKEFLTEYPESLQQRMLNQWGRVRAESSAECWLRLSKGVPWVKISENSLTDLLLDYQVVEWPGTNALRVEILGEKMEFRGALIQAEPRMKIRVRYCAENPVRLWVQDTAGRILGTLERVDRAHYHDAEHLRELATFKATELAKGIQDVRRLELSNPAAVKEIQDNINTAAILSAFENPHAAPAPTATIQSETSDALVTEIEGRTAGRPRKTKEPEESAADRYLRRKR